jgi:hypothetical protein
MILSEFRFVDVRSVLLAASAPCMALKHCVCVKQSEGLNTLESMNSQVLRLEPTT